MSRRGKTGAESVCAGSLGFSARPPVEAGKSSNGRRRAGPGLGDPCLLSSRPLTSLFPRDPAVFGLPRLLSFGWGPAGAGWRYFEARNAPRAESSGGLGGHGLFLHASGAAPGSQPARQAVRRSAV